MTDVTKDVLIRTLSFIPIPILKKIGFSTLGSFLAANMRKKESDSWYEIENGIKIYFEITNPLTWQLIQGKDFEKNIKDIFLDNISEENIVVDVGSHIGEFSLIASKKMNGTGQVISIEPFTEARNWLKKNIELNQFKNIIILPVGIGKKIEEKTLYRNSLGGTIGYLESDIEDVELIPEGTVKVTTIDEIVRSRGLDKIDMLKIDVEGFEYEVLLGCLESFKEKKIKKIICEIHPLFLEGKLIEEDEIYTLLKNHGFSLKIIDEIKFKKTKHLLATL